MAKIGLELALLEGANQMQMAIVDMDAGQVLGWVAMDETDVSRHIDRVGEIRAMMAEPVAPTLDPGSRMSPPPLSGWKVIPVRADGVADPGTLLALRHPGKGWLGWFLQESEAREIGQALIDWAGKEA